MTGIDGKCCRKSGKWYHPKFSVMDGEGFIPLSHVCVCVSVKEDVLPNRGVVFV